MREYWWRCLLVALLGACFLSGCVPNRTTQKPAATKKKYMFPEGKRWGKASERKYYDGDLIPDGGGHFKVGKPYKIDGKMYYPQRHPKRKQVGLASWYGLAFHGRKTANGEFYDRKKISAAHPTMPLPSYVRVTNLANGRSMVVRVNNRGPFIGNRIIDLSEAAANVLGFRDVGLAKVSVHYLGVAPLGGSDQRKLLSTFKVMRSSWKSVFVNKNKALARKIVYGRSTSRSRRRRTQDQSRGLVLSLHADRRPEQKTSPERKTRRRVISRGFEEFISNLDVDLRHKSW